MIIKGYIFGIGYALLCLLLALALYKGGLAQKYTRKVVHILVGFEWVILYHFMGAGVHFLAVCVLFLIILTVAYKGRMMPMISSDAENAPGTVYYAVAMTGVAIVGCFNESVMLPFGIGVLCTSIGDGLAGVVGQLIKKHNPKIYREKSLFGALANLVFSSLTAFVLSYVYEMGLTVPECIMLGVLSVELELFTGWGFDNITLCWGVTALAWCFMYYGNIYFYIVPILLTAVIIAFALSKKALSLGGVIGAVILDIAVSIAFGNFGFIVLISFFLGSVAVDKLKKKYKKNVGKHLEKRGDCRDIVQVMANGGVSFIAALAYLFTEQPIFAVTFTVGMAEAFADTVASGVGAFSRSTFDPFRFKKCEKGISGGMSLLGTFSALIASILISLIARSFRFRTFGLTEAIITAACAFIGCIFDSFLGSLLQVKYTCSVCGRVTEREMHCNKKCTRLSGISFIDNDTVNFLSGAFSAILATLITVAVQ